MVERNQHLKKNIIKEIYFNKCLSIAALSIQLNKSIPIIFKMVNELLEEGIISDNGFAPSTGGRRAAVYSLKSDMQYIVAVAMDQLITRIALMDSTYNTIIGTVEQIELPLNKNKAALNTLTRSIKKFIKESEIEKDKIIGIGIAMPGFIDAKKGMNHSFLESDESIADIICKATGLPVFIDNDSSLIAFAELKFGNGIGKANAMVVNIGWGVGLGIILNSKLYRGHNGFAGEFSHISLFSNNKLCSCGKVGCLETETSLLVIIEKARQGLNEGRNSILKDQILNVDVESAFKLIINAAKKGDQFAIELISKAAYEIGRGVSILIHLLNPEIIILSGRGAIAGDIWKTRVQQAINEYSIPSLASNIKIEISQLNHQAELIGAAALVMENYGEANFHHSKSNRAIYQ